MLLLAPALAALLACSPAGDAKETGADDTDPVVVLEGCEDPANWACNEPSAGYEYGCVAVCDGRVQLTCNQNYEGGTCILSTGDECDVPRDPSGCAICYAAIVDQCAEVIDP